MAPRFAAPSSHKHAISQPRAPSHRLVVMAPTLSGELVFVRRSGKERGLWEMEFLFM